MSGQKEHSAHARWEVSCLGGLRSTRLTVSSLVMPYDRCTEVERYAPCSAMRGSVESQCKDDSRRILERILAGHLLAQTHGGTTADGLRKGVWNEQFSVGSSTPPRQTAIRSPRGRIGLNCEKRKNLCNNPWPKLWVTNCCQIGGSLREG